MDLLRIKEKHQCSVIYKCSENKCKLNLDTGIKSVVLKGEKVVGISKKICDCIIFQEDQKIILVELKGKDIDADIIREKFINSIREAVEIACISRKGHYNIYLILLATNYGRSSEIPMLRQPLLVDSKRHSIVTCECNHPVSLKKLIT